VARTLLGLMQAAAGNSNPLAAEEAGADPGAAVARHWLRGAGRPALLRALGLHERLADVWRAVARRAALPAYLATLLAGTTGLVAWMLLHRHVGWLAADLPWAPTLLAVLLMLFPASEAVVAVVNRLISESARPAVLPRLALAAGIPAEHRVMVVIPALLGDSGSTRELVHRLLLHHLANPEPNAQFALLTDHADADSARLPGDAAQLAEVGSRSRHSMRSIRCGPPTAARRSRRPTRRRPRTRRRPHRASSCCTESANSARPSSAGSAGNASAASSNS
jgi:cyclic beta-1,2-glucan synthetase